jgi:hypothetical protein
VIGVVAARRRAALDERRMVAGAHRDEAVVHDRSAEVARLAAQETSAGVERERLEAEEKAQRAEAEKHESQAQQVDPDSDG